MEILSNEQEIVRFINHGKDILIKSSKNDASNIMKIIDAVEKRWLKIRETSEAGRTRMDSCKENFKKFYGAQDKFLPWLEKAELKKQEKEFQNFRNDVNKHEAEFDYNFNVGDSFQAACDTDREIVKGEIGHMKERWENLNHFISERAQDMADIFTKLGDSNENVKELEHGLKATDNSPKDPILLVKTKWLSDGAKDLEKSLGKVQKGGEDLLIDAIGADGQPIREHEKLHDDIIIVGDEDAQALSDKVEKLTNCYAYLVTNFHQSHNHISDWMNGVGGIIQSLDTYSLEEQEEEIHRLEGDGARAVEGLVTRDNRKFETIYEQEQKRGEIITLAKQKLGEVLGFIDELLNWFREVKGNIQKANPPSHEPEVIRV